ncbi:MAG TPA: DUF3488 and transglutaminase-like domain-containing protein [Pseudonocardiaceae bacterium]|jgi:transglutaminase-like putative cysteine protease|nr:DUF3488 and transglutaminase-like domain-containing protein [Pseudonocardiaceae bacterium]
MSVRVAGSRPAGSTQSTVTVSSLAAMPLAGAFAVICTSTALSGVVTGSTWLGYVIAAVTVVAAVGTALRAMRAPRVLIWVLQLGALVCLTVLMFTDTGVLFLFPGPAAVHDLGGLLNQSINEIRTGVPPVAADPAMLCLITLCIGSVAVAVDTLVATARVPATAGLVLLCVYAVPASLAGKMLPWWSFVLGAAAYTVLLAVDGVQRHQRWRGRMGLPATESTGVAPAAIAVTSVAAVLALIVGGTVTAIGTAGRLPGSGATGTATQLGIKPFTTLRGMLQAGDATELFDVHGLPDDAPYLRALTLSRYQPNVGFVSDSTMPAGVSADGPLPAASGGNATGPATDIAIEPVAWNDVWLPVFGQPRQLSNIFYTYRYDVSSGIVYNQRSMHPNEYVEQAGLAEPNAGQLRSSGADYNQVDPKYLQTGPIDPRVTALAQRITARATTPFDRAVAIYSYFTTPGNGFVYSTQTGATTTTDALVDFLFNNKTGYCEQYSTAMAVLLRTLGIPTRVAIGFTDGTVSGDHRIITSRDAHAWDEVYFPSYGWVPFDPTPLTDGRGRVPAYLAAAGASPGAPGAGVTGGQNPRGGSNPSQTNQPAGQTPATPAGAGRSSAPPDSGWPWWTLIALLVIAIAVTVLAVRTTPGRRPSRIWDRLLPERPWTHARHRLWLVAAFVTWALVLFFAAALLAWWLAALVLLAEVAILPAALREFGRRRRVHAINAMASGSVNTDAASAAWAELVAESWDRGRPIPDTDTVRTAASRMIRDHDLDDEGQHGLRALVGAVERSWYAGQPEGASAGVAEAFRSVRRSLRRTAPLALRARLLPRSVVQRPSSNRRRNRSSMR